MLTVYWVLSLQFVQETCIYNEESDVRHQGTGYAKQLPTLSSEPLEQTASVLLFQKTPEHILRTLLPLSLSFSLPLFVPPSFPLLPSLLFLSLPHCFPPFPHPFSLIPLGGKNCASSGVRKPLDFRQET